jgi:hypothetical protein
VIARGDQGAEPLVFRGVDLVVGQSLVQDAAGVPIRAVSQAGQPLPYPNIITTISSWAGFLRPLAPAWAALAVGGSAISPASR